MLRLRDRHAVSWHDHHTAGSFQDIVGILDRDGLHFSLDLGTFRRSPTKAREEDIAQGAIHRLAHDDREDQATRTDQVASDDIHETSVSGFTALDANNSVDVRVAYRRHEPATITFMQLPNNPPAITFDDNAGNALRAQFAAVYDSGIGSKPIKLCKLDSESAAADWSVYYTPGYMTVGVAPTLQWDENLADVDGFDSTLVPNTGNVDAAQVTIYGSPASSDQVHDYYANRREAAQQSLNDEFDTFEVRIR